MKKFVAIILSAFVLIVSLAGCKRSIDSTSNMTQTNTSVNSITKSSSYQNLPSAIVGSNISSVSSVSSVVNNIPKKSSAGSITSSVSSSQSNTTTASNTVISSRESSVNSPPSSDYDYTINNNTVTITQYTGSSDTVALPTTIDGRNVVAVGDNAFYGNHSLKSVTIPSGYTSIGQNAFYECYLLSVVSIADSVATIGTGAFQFCASLTTLTLPNSLKTFTCSSISPTILQTINIPASVTTIIMDYAETALVNWNVSLGNPNYSSNNGILFNKNQTTLINYPAGKPDTNYTIPTGCTRIAQYAFHDVSIIYGSLTIPATVTYLETNAFYGTIYKIYFQGNTPTCAGSIGLSSSTTVFYHANMSGWGSNLWQGCFAQPY
jgi:hypothetical protein